MSQDSETSPTKKRPLSETNPGTHLGEPETKKLRKEETETKDNFPDLEKLQTQIEYYFSIDNLPFDDFMLKHLQQNNGWFTIATLLDFRNVAQITNSVDKIVSAIKRSEKLIYDASQGRVKRNENRTEYLPPLQQINNHIIFAKGFSPRMQKEALKAYWEHTLGESKVLAVRPILVQLTTQSDFSKSKDNNKKNKDKQTQQILKQFMGDCYVLLRDIETVKQACGKTFDCSGRLILTGPSNFYKAIDQLEVKNEVLPFQEDKCLYIQNLPYYATWLDIEKWIMSELDNLAHHVAYVYKHCGENFAYARLDENSSAAQVEDLLNSRPLMGIQPKAKALSVEESQKIWSVVGIRRIGASVNVVMLDKTKKSAEFQV